MNPGHGLCGLVGIAELIFHHTHNAVGVLCAVGRIAADVFVAQLGCLRCKEAFLGGQGCADASGQVGQCLILMVNVVSRQSAPRIGQNLIRHPLSGGEPGRVVSGGFSCGKYQLCCLDDIAEFFAYVGFSCNVVHIGYKSCLGSDHFGNSSLASGVGMAVVVCKHQRQIACVARYSLIVAAAHKYAVIGYKACLLYTSSSVKAVLNEYYSRGLRIIEVYKHQFKALSDVLEQIKDRNYKFIIYMDDLSFEDYELEYKYLKAILEGGLGKRPDNVLIYATSNRRHLIREKFSDKRELDDELHDNDTVQEKLSLASRFGVTIYFGSPDKRQFETIVKALADRCHLDMPEDELYREANKWELSHGGLSGRTASQFITHLLGRQRMD